MRQFCCNWPNCAECALLAGVTPNAVLQALSVNVPAPASLWTYDALGSAVNGSADGLAFLRTNTAVTNLITAGANLLTNDSSVYASYAIIMNQALARKVLLYLHCMIVIVLVKNCSVQYVHDAFDASDCKSPDDSQALCHFVFYIASLYRQSLTKLPSVLPSLTTSQVIVRYTDTGVGELIVN